MATQSQRNEYDQRAEQPKPAREKPDFAALSQQFPNWNAADLEIVWERNDEIQTVSDFKFFLYYCKTQVLDPIIGDVVATSRWNSIKRRNVLTPIVTIGVLRKRRAEACDGIDQFTFEHNGKLPVCASGTIYRKGCARPFSATVYYDEYAATDRNGNVTSMWRDKSHVMISKCLESVLTRLGFYDLVGDVLIDEETQRNGHEAPAETEAEGDYTVGEKPAPEAKALAPVVEMPTKAKPAEPAKAPPVTPPAPPPAAPEPPPPAAAEVPAPEPTPAPAAEPTFDDLITQARTALGGEQKDADKLIARYFGSYLEVKPVGNRLTLPKDRTKLLPPLKALIAVLDSRLGELRVDPEALGNALAGRTKSRLEQEMDLMGWPANVRAQGAKVMAETGMDEPAFLAWLQAPIAGEAKKGTALAVASMDNESLETFLPLFLLVKGKAFEILDYAIEHGLGVRQVLFDMVKAAGLPIDKWDTKFAEEVLKAIQKVASGESVTPPPAAPREDDWATGGGLPFEV